VFFCFFSQFTPRILEFFSSNFLLHSPSIQEIDWRNNDIGLRGGWAIIDSLRLRSKNFTPITVFLIESEKKKEHFLSKLIEIEGGLPIPNVEKTKIDQQKKPLFWGKLEEILQTNRVEKELRLLKNEKNNNNNNTIKQNQSAIGSASKSPILASKSHTSSSSSSLSPSTTTTTTTTSTPSSSTFLSVSHFHSALAPILNELDLERFSYQKCKNELNLKTKELNELQIKFKSTEEELFSLRYQLGSTQSELNPSHLQLKERDQLILSLRDEISSMVSSHSRTLLSVTNRADLESVDRQYFSSELLRLRSFYEEEIIKYRKEIRETREARYAILNTNEEEKINKLNQLEIRLEAIRAERELSHQLALQRNTNSHDITFHTNHPGESTSNNISPNQYKRSIQQSITPPSLSSSSSSLSPTRSSHTTTPTPGGSNSFQTNTTTQHHHYPTYQHTSSSHQATLQPLAFTPATVLHSHNTYESSSSSSSSHSSTLTSSSSMRHPLNVSTQPISPDKEHSFHPSTPPPSSISLPHNLLVPTHNLQLLPQQLPPPPLKAVGPLKLKPKQRE
jgi:ribosomal protein L29